MEQCPCAGSRPSLCVVILEQSMRLREKEVGIVDDDDDDDEENGGNRTRQH